MVEYSLLDVPPVASLDDPQWGWVFAAMTRLDDTVSMARFGNTDLVDPPLSRFVDFNTQEDEIKILKLATAGSGPDLHMIVGYAYAVLPRGANTDKAELEVVVHPDWTDISVGNRLLTLMENQLAKLGRTELILSTGFGPNDDRPPHENAPQGGRQPSDLWNAQLALSHGYTLSQVERQSVLTLPMETDIYKAMMSDAVVRSTGYRVHSWIGDTPEIWINKYADLRGGFLTLAPSGLATWDDEQWDAARVVRRDQYRHDRKFTAVTSVAEEMVSGNLVGFTEINVPERVPTPAGFQDITMVLPHHHGHRLGRLLKLFNMSRLQMERTDIVRIYTWNAEENAHMLGINIAMGFHAFGGSGRFIKWM